MSAENEEKLVEALYRKGFGDGLNAELKAKLAANEPEFVLTHETLSEKDELNYRLHFRKDEETGKVYFNKYDLALKLEGSKTVLEHTFPTDKLITAAEAYRMLKYGDLVSVNKTLFNKEGAQYNAWFNINTNGEKDEYNSYPVNSYHENYYKREPFDLRKELASFPIPVKQLERASFFEDIEKSLKKANLVKVTYLADGLEEAGFLAVNPKVGKVVLLDSSLDLVEGQSQQVARTTAPEKVEEVKKKPEQQRVNWGKSPANKGASL